MRWLGAVAAAVLCVPVPVSPCAAQDAYLLLGGVHARYGDSVSGTAGILGIETGVRGARVSARGSMAVSQFATGEWAWQGSGRAMVAQPLHRTLAIGLLTSGSLNDYEGGQLSGEWVASGVASLARSGWSLVGQLGGGLVRQIDANTLGFGTAAATAARQIFPGITARGNLAVVGAANVTYGDFGFEAIYESASLTVSGGLGVRMGDIRDDPFGRARIEYRASEMIGVEVSAGRYAPDLVGFQEGLYATMRLRVALVSPKPPPPPTTPPVLVESVADSLVAVTIRYTDSAQQVQIAGAWNGWQPVPMHAIGRDQWRAVLRIPSGIHEFSLVVDGDEWTVPDGAVLVPDALGGEVAVLVIPAQS